MNRTATQRRLAQRLALLILGFVAAATLPYIWLIEHFRYDDILRDPPAVILEAFAAGGAPLVLAWFAFAASALLFIPVVLGFRAMFAAYGARSHAAEVLGIASAIAQAAGLLRWVFVVPGLAAVTIDPQASPAARDSALLIFTAFHHFGGMVLGEFLGQMLLAGWTALTLWQSRASTVMPAWLQWLGAATLPLWIAGQTEILHQTAPAVPAFEVIPAAFMLWEAWLVLFALALLRDAWITRPGDQHVSAAA